VQGLIDALITCGRPTDAAERLLDLDRPTEALSVLREAGESARVTRLRAKADVALGAVDRGRSRLAGIGREATVQDSLRLADLRLARGETSREAAVRDFIAAAPTEREALRLAAAHPEWSPFASLRLDTEAAIGAYESGPPMRGSAVRVLDHSALLFLGGDESVRWIHEILAIRSREAAESFGELGLPTEARALSVFTRKADGRRLYAEDTPEKETLSLPGLAVGDYVVAIYLEAGDNGYLYDHGMLSPRVFFRGVDLPIFHQRFEVFGPSEAPLVVETENDAPPAEAVTLGDRTGWRFEAREVPLWNAEPRSVSAALWLPWVRVGQGIDFDEGLKFLRNELLEVRRRTDRFDAWVRAHWRGSDLAQRVTGLLRAVQDAVDGTEGLASGDAATAIETGSGNRALVASAALESVGVDHRLVVARPRVHDSGGVFSQPTDFVYPLIQLADGTWVDPGQPGAAIGFMPFVFVGGEAVVLWPMGAHREPIALPQRRVNADSRDVTIDARWRADGVVEGHVVDTLRGQEGIVIGGYLRRLDENVRPRLVERLLGGVFGAARVSELVFDHEDGALVLRYRFEARTEDRMTVGLFPILPGRSFAPLAQRTTPLHINLPTEQRVRLTLSSAGDFKVDGGSVRHEIDAGAFLFSREVSAGDDTLEVESTLRIRGGVVEPAAYKAFGRWARKVDAAEQVILTLRAPQSSP
jgi:hypothetical protein